MQKISAPEIIQSLIGAWRIFLRDPSGVAFFGKDINAFWKSFWCAIIILPAYCIMVILRFIELEAPEDTTLTLDPIRIISVEMISYIIGWVIWPLIMLEGVKFLDQQKNYLSYVIIYNWSQAPVLLFALTMIGLESTGLIPGGLSLIMGLAFYVWIILVHIFVFKITMKLRLGLALPLALAEIVVGIIIFSFKFNMLKVI